MLDLNIWIYSQDKFPVLCVFFCTVIYLKKDIKIRFTPWTMEEQMSNLY